MNRIFVLMLGLILAATCRAQEETLTYGSSSFSLVKDESMLFDGDKIIVVGQKYQDPTYLFALGEKDKDHNNFGAVVVKKKDDNTLSLDVVPTILTLVKQDNCWLLKYEDEYLYPGEYDKKFNDNNWLKTKSVYSDDCSVAIFVDKTNCVIAEFFKSKRKSKVLGFYTQNKVNGVFACYASDKQIRFYVQRTTNTLDEQDDNISSAIKTGVQNISVKRAFHKGGWNTWCMPFDISLSKLKTVLGDGTEVSEFKSVSDGVMQFYPVTGGLKAGTPYLVKPENEVENPLFESVYVVENQPSDVTVGGYSFCGTFTPYELKGDGTELFLNSKNVLAKPSVKSNKMRGLRAYFRIENPQSAAKVCFMDTPTAIGEVKTAQIQTSTVYNMLGQKLNINKENLPKGMYIINGKKLYKK